MSDWFDLVPGWLGRKLKPEDGAPLQDIDAAVKKIAAQGFSVPAALRALHLRLGACKPLMRGFNRFVAPSAWKVLDGHLLFLDENQDVCQWILDADSRVWMVVNEERHPEELTLGDFLAVVLPYQLAQGGWPCTADMVLPLADATAVRQKIAIELGWPEIVRHNGLTIYGKDASMLWWLDPARDDTDQHLFVSCLHQSDLDDLCSRFGFADLG
ncbi:hypothetical protein [Labrys neptuniae]|uniref:SMI1/KNR4 family protein n=1 Tax=Labrys neptuniae TaxID=376174 RepID=A0ABV3PS40_9HYPH